ncbi:hypothetical protein [Akkermansia sp.]|uniref:hypothetical protein n=1 Tax=Akkermansia sp. TaxID=1872421 RepID=UPI003AB4CA17
MKKNLILLLSVLCVGGLYGEEKTTNTLSTPPLPEFNSEAFIQKCVLLPLKHQDRYWGWKSNEAMLVFCKWFKPEEKGIKLNYNGNTLHFIVTYPEITEVHGFNVYVVNISSKTAIQMEQELKKKDVSDAGTPVPTVQIAKVVSSEHLIVIHGKSQYRNIMRGILNNITKFMAFE